MPPLQPDVSASASASAQVLSRVASPLTLQTLLDAVEEVGGTFMLTADHGNAEDMVQVGGV
jgi:2,3-bisphosphoglycerate-independent phosphoglycerate mutase